MLRQTRSVFARVFLTLLIGVSAAAAAEEPKVQKLTFGSGGVNRSYYLFIPEKAAAGNAPLLLLLHGSGRNGRTLVDPWLPLAKSEGIVLVAPDASDPQAWRVPQEGPDFFYNLVELVRITHDVVDEWPQERPHEPPARRRRAMPVCGTRDRMLSNLAVVFRLSPSRSVRVGEPIGQLISVSMSRARPFYAGASFDMGGES